MTTKGIWPYGEFEMDESTGLPVVPDGHFIRVTRVFSGFWQVQLRRRRRGWFSQKIEDRTFGDETPVTRESILLGAAFVMYRYNKRAHHASDTTLIGDYPPKRLTNSRVTQEGENP